MPCWPGVAPSSSTWTARPSEALTNRALPEMLLPLRGSRTAVAAGPDALDTADDAAGADEVPAVAQPQARIARARLRMCDPLRGGRHTSKICACSPERRSGEPQDVPRLRLEHLGVAAEAEAEVRPEQLERAGERRRVEPQHLVPRNQ